MIMIKKINANLKNICCKNNNLIFFDIGKLFLEEKDSVKLNLMPDGLHLNKYGYEILGTHLVKIIENYWV
jgi:lysophospholipase L1-like esterase